MIADAGVGHWNKTGSKTQNPSLTNFISFTLVYIVYMYISFIIVMHGVFMAVSRLSLSQKNDIYGPVYRTMERMIDYA
ncbi:hypothetical protein MNBD_NITROSPINAE02-159 [hydrothermal vent metagenome]|uniref:Uncharacterized protein n=1 Tax=hydrothermal vent metagenome TaxID=652676 RepID=A0A3B1CXI3_9ZZZZ